MALRDQTKADHSDGIETGSHQQATGDGMESGIGRRGDTAQGGVPRGDVIERTALSRPEEANRYVLLWSGTEYELGSGPD